MATGPRLVNKQFNSPIGLYSQQNIQDTLSKQTQVLNNGAVGIDFNNPMATKPANLANSAVLRMLEEEEQRQRSGQQGSLKRVAWPPPPEENGEEPQQEAPVRQAAPAPEKVYQSPALSRLIPIDQEYAPPQAKVYSPQPVPPVSKTFAPLSPQIKPLSPQPAFGSRSPLSPQPSTPTQTFPPPIPEVLQKVPSQTSAFSRPAPRAFAPVSPLDVIQAAPFNPSPDFGPSNLINSISDSYFQGFGPVASAAAPTASESPRGWAPVPSPTPVVAPIQNQFVEPPPATVALRPTAPIHQAPPAVVTSQPATNSFRGGVNMRGDQKWPPQSVKDAVAAENDARVTLARGPACRPRKVKKDYGQFFAQNALPHNYPGYRAPPGTQHFEDMTGRSQY